jgi:hypothetical protein
MSNRAPYVKVTEAWQAEQASKRAAYEASRRRWTRSWFDEGKPEPLTDTDPPNRRGRIVHDPRQFRFDW